MNNVKLILRNNRPAVLAWNDPSRHLPLPVRPVDPPFTLLEAVSVLRRHKWLIAGCVAVGLLLALAASLTMTPKFESASVIEINREDSDTLGLNKTLGSLGDGGGGLDQAVSMETHAHALQSDTLALQVIDHLHLDSRPEFQTKTSAWKIEKNGKDESGLPLELAPLRRERLLRTFHKNLTVKAIAGSRLIEVRYLSPDPEVAATVVNTLLNDYIEQYFQTRYAATAQASSFLSNQLAELKTQVETAQQKLVDYQRESGILGTDNTNNVVMLKLQDLNRELTEAQGNRITRQVIYELAKSGNPELLSGLAGTSISAGSGTALNSLGLLQTLRAQEAELKIQYAQAATKYGSAYPKLVEMGNQLEALNTAIQNEIQKVASRAESDYQAAAKTEGLLQSSFDKQKSDAIRLNDKAIQYTILKHEADSSSKLYDELLEKLKTAGVLSGLRSSKIVVVDPARTAAEPVRPNFPMNHAIGFAGGLLLGVALAFFKESGDTTVRNPDDVEAATFLPQLGLIPDFKFASLQGGALRKKIWGKSRPQISAGSKSEFWRPSAIAPADSSVAEAYRQIRSSIVLSDLGFPKVLLITSPLSEEGKTTTAINLAVVLAQQGSKVLLVDADMRRPAIHSRLNMSTSFGLSSILASKDGTGVTAVEYSDQPGLFVLCAGPKPACPADLLGSRQMTELVNLWCGQFDIVVMDSAPVLSVTDAVVLSSKVDAVLLVARSEKTSRQSLVRTRDMLLRANAKIAGFVMNGVDLNSWDYHQYYG